MRGRIRGKINSVSTVLFLVVSGLVGLLNFSGEYVQAFTNVIGSQYDGSGGPWNLTGSPYIVVGDVFVPAGQNLTIEPGVQVRFDGYYSIEVYGTLHAVGTPTSRINITSNKGAPATGDWYRIFVSSSDAPAEISYADISYADEGIRIWPLVSGNIIMGNNITNNNYGIILEGISNNSISGNNISNNDYGFYLDSSSGNNITGNNMSFNNEYGIYLKDSLNNNITGNNFIDNGIFVNGGQLSHFNSHNIPPDNTVNGKPLYYYKDCSGIDVDGIPVGQLILANCTNVNVRNLQIDNTYIGIQVAYSNNTNITGNNVSSNGWFGIYLYSSSNNYIEGNNASYNTACGIFLYLSSNNDIKNNSVSSNSWRGIYLYTSSNNNSIIGNNVLDNEEGAVLHLSSNNNTIYHNNFNNILSDASDESIGNTWNDTYSQSPLRGGNYWSNWSPTCTDNMNGPSQNIAGADGICDGHYHINVNTIDHYPLKNMWPRLDTTPPDAVALAAGAITSTSVQLNWTAVADNDSDPASGAAYGYDIRFSLGSGCLIADPGTWATATQATGEPIPQAIGSAESFTVTGLLQGTAYCFAAKVRDEAPNWSPLSNNLEATTLTIPVDNNPHITVVSIIPPSQVQGGSINITADVTDDSGTVNNVSVQIIAPDGTAIGNFTMENGGGDEYYYVFQVDSDADAGVYKFVIWAEDASGNVEESAEGSFIVTPAVKPPGPDFLREWWWLFLVFAIIIVAIALLFLMSRRRKKPVTQTGVVKAEQSALPPLPQQLPPPPPPPQGPPISQ